MATPFSLSVPDYAGAASRAVTSGLSTAKALREGAADWQDYFTEQKKAELERARIRGVDLTQQAGLQLPGPGAGAAGALPQNLWPAPGNVPGNVPLPVQMRNAGFSVQPGVVANPTQQQATVPAAPSADVFSQGYRPVPVPPLLPELGAGAAGAFPQDLGQVPQQVVPSQQVAPTQPQGPTPIDIDSSGLAGLSGGQLRAAMAPIFEQLETRGNLPRGYLDIVASIETGGSFDPNAQNEDTSAGGLFQFLDATAAQYGLVDKFNPAASAAAAARFTQANATQLKKSLNRQPTALELWLAHNQGAGGAAALLKNPNASALSVLTRVYNGDADKATRAIVGNGGNVDMTAGQFANTVMGFYDSYATSAPQRGPSGAVPTYAGVQGQPMQVTTPSGQTVTLPFRAQYLNSEDPSRALREVAEAIQVGRYDTLPATNPIASAWRTVTGWLGSETAPAEQQLAEQASAASDWARSDEARDWFTRNPNDLVQFATDPVGYFTAYNNAVATGAATYEQMSTSIGETLSANPPLSQPSGNPPAAAGLQPPEPTANAADVPSQAAGIQTSTQPAPTQPVVPEEVREQERARVAEMISGTNYELEQAKTQAEAQRTAKQQEYNLKMQRREALAAQANNASTVGDTATFNTLREEIATIDSEIIKLNEGLASSGQPDTTTFNTLREQIATIDSEIIELNEELASSGQPDTTAFNTLREQIAEIDSEIITSNEELARNDQELFRPVLRKQLELAEYALLNAQDPRYLEQLFNSRHNFKIGLRYVNTDASGNDNYLLTSKASGQSVLVNQNELITRIRRDIDPEYRAGQAATQAAMAVKQQELNNKLTEIAAEFTGEAALKRIKDSFNSVTLTDPDTGIEKVIVWDDGIPYEVVLGRNPDGLEGMITTRRVYPEAGLNEQK